MRMRTQPSPCNKTSLAPLWLLKSQDNIPAMTHHFWAKSPRVRVLQTICCLFQFIPGTSPFIAHSLKRMYVVNPPLCLWKRVSLATRDYLSDGLSVVLLRYNYYKGLALFPSFWDGGTLTDHRKPADKASTLLLGFPDYLSDHMGPRSPFKRPSHSQASLTCCSLLTEIKSVFTALVSGLFILGKIESWPSVLSHLLLLVPLMSKQTIGRQFSFYKNLILVC